MILCNVTRQIREGSCCEWGGLEQFLFSIITGKRGWECPQAPRSLLPHNPHVPPQGAALVRLRAGFRCTHTHLEQNPLHLQSSHLRAGRHRGTDRGIWPTSESANPINAAVWSAHVATEVTDFCPQRNILAVLPISKQQLLSSFTANQPKQTKEVSWEKNHGMLQSFYKQHLISLWHRVKLSNGRKHNQMLIVFKELQKDQLSSYG